MIDVATEKLIRLVDVPDLPWLPARRGGAKLAVWTLQRWVKHGRRGVKLETISVGGSACTSEAALLRFFDRSARAGRTPEARPATPRQHRIAHERAEAILDRLGV